METAGRVVVADLEAGIGTLTRMQAGTVDAVLVLVEPNPKSIEVGVRAAALAEERTVGRIVVVANRVRSDDDVERVRTALPGYEIIEVPDDLAIVQADREGRSPLDHAPEAPAVVALTGLAERLSA